MGAPRCGSVLVVDDDPDLLAVARRELEQRGVRAVVAGAGELALSLALEEHFDVIAADDRLSRSCGRRWFAQLRSASPRSALVLLTDDTETELTVARLKGEVDGLVFKPCEGEALADALMNTAPSGRKGHQVASGSSRAAEPLLLIEPDPVEVAWLRVLLRKTASEFSEGRLVTSLAEALEALEGQRFAAIVTSLDLADARGPDLLGALRASASSLPFIALRDQDAAPASVAELAQAGADHQITRGGTDAAEFARVLRHALDAKGLEQHLVYLAEHDATTGLMNRRSFLDHLARFVARSPSEASRAALFLADIGDFKRINHALGLEAGDRVLAAFGQALQVFSAHGYAARLGGDDFACLLPSIGGIEQARRAAHELQRQVTLALQAESRGYRPFVAVGAALLADDCKSANRAMKAAEAALAAAKADRSGVGVYADELRRADARREDLVDALGEALQRSEFALEYQPLYSFRDGRVLGIEALLRWRRERPATGSDGSPAFENIPPIEFIPLLERSGLILEVGAWVLRTACDQLRAWRDGGHDALRLAVNLSPRQFGDSLLGETIADATQRAGIDPGQLELEVTESILLDDVQGSADCLNELQRKHGIRFAIDDFGTGYSSLAYLRRFAFNTLKMDRLFVADITTSESNASVTAGIIQLGHSLGMEVVAEGVETSEQLQLLRAQRCDLAQGFGLQRPRAPGVLSLEQRDLDAGANIQPSAQR